MKEAVMVWGVCEATFLEQDEANNEWLSPGCDKNNTSFLLTTLGRHKP